MGVKTYELTYIISSSLNSEKVSSETKEIESFIKIKEGVLLGSNEDRASAQTLAYPIKKQRSGYFITLTFQILEDKIKELKEKLEKNIDILRHFIIIKKPTKELKKRRTKKPLTVLQSKTTDKSSIFKNEKNEELEKVDLDKIDKKLDEILSE